MGKELSKMPKDVSKITISIPDSMIEKIEKLWKEKYQKRKGLKSQIVIEALEDFFKKIEG